MLSSRWGIGLETARQFGARGFTVLAGARDAQRGLEAEQVLRAGGAVARGNPVSQTDLDVMREVYEVNVFGVIRVTNAMLPLLRRARAARIVNVSSEVGSIGSQTDPASPLARMPASLAYPSSKAALNMITAMYAKDLRDTPVKVNARAASCGATYGPPTPPPTPTGRSPGSDFHVAKTFVPLPVPDPS
jgi:NAD(P)-dependent dehydrogenase (short-subunit alcohol dehydrogenase family)